MLRSKTLWSLRIGVHCLSTAVSRWVSIASRTSTGRSCSSWCQGSGRLAITGWVTCSVLLLLFWRRCWLLLLSEEEETMMSTTCEIWLNLFLSTWSRVLLYNLLRMSPSVNNSICLVFSGDTWVVHQESRQSGNTFFDSDRGLGWVGQKAVDRLGNQRVTRSFNYLKLATVILIFN